MRKDRRVSEMDGHGRNESQHSRKCGRKGVRNSRKVTYGLLGLAAVMLLGSTIGSTRAALTYYSENYTAEITVSQIGVSLLENGERVSSRDYDKNDWKVSSNAGNASDSGVLLQNMLEKGEKLALNKKYREELRVENSGEIDEYVRVRIYKYWTKENESGGVEKITTLSPKLIDLELVNEDQWIMNPDDAAAAANGEKECIELYYKNVLPANAGEKSITVPFAENIMIDGQVASAAEVRDDGKGTITTVYKYDGVRFNLDVEVDAVQTHNAQDAIKSAWGVDAAALGISVRED